MHVSEVKINQRMAADCGTRCFLSAVASAVSTADSISRHAVFALRPAVTPSASRLSEQLHRPCKYRRMHPGASRSHKWRGAGKGVGDASTVPQRLAANLKVINSDAEKQAAD